MQQTKLLRIAVLLTVIIAAIVLFVAASASLHWRYVHDSPLMIYAGFLVTSGSVPYRDFFDINMPGTYFVMAAIGRVFGWDDFGFRVFDLLCLASISVSTFIWARRFGNLSALAASVAFPLWYLNGGPSMSIQREYIALVPFAGMLAVTAADTGFRPGLRAFVAGLLAGAAFLIKPQFLLLSLPLLINLLQPCITSVSVHRRIAAFFGGISIPIGAIFLYLLVTGALGPFVDMAINYWPLYSHMTGKHVIISGLHHFLYIVKSTGAGLMTLYVPMAIIGIIDLYDNQTQKQYACVVGSLLIAAALYPALSGQFWRYHWIPFYYVALCAASLPARAVPIKGWSIGGIWPTVLVIILLFSLIFVSIKHLRGAWEGNPKSGAPDEIVRFLSSHMSSEDTVQPLDWTGGAVHGMLMARAPLATRFMYDFHFYHHISSPYIGKLRRDFMNELVVNQPKFIIQILKNRPWPTGIDTTREFPDLQTYLKQHYSLAQQGATYRILQRIDGIPNKVIQRMSYSRG